VKIRRLVFDEHNRRHIARHGIEEIEVRSACGNRHIIRQARNGRLLLLGEVLPVRRILAVVLQPMAEPGHYRVVTAHYANQRERALFDAGSEGDTSHEH